jgi:hypothetical protein
MNKLIKTQYIFLNSENRKTGTPYDFTIDFPNRYIECEDDEILCVTLMNFNVYCSWYNVNDTNKSFTITRVSNNTTTNITLPTGNYPFKLLYQTVNALAGSNICSFNKIKNKFRFTFDEPHTITFNDTSYELLGFTAGSSPSMTTQIGVGQAARWQIESDDFLNPFNELDNLCVHLSGVQPYRSYNLDNMIGTDVVVSNLLCPIPLTTAPYDMLNWVNVGNQYQMYIYDKSIQSLNFKLTDFKNEPLTYLPNFNMTLKVETFQTYDEDKRLITLKKILEYTKMNFLRVKP